MTIDKQSLNNLNCIFNFQLYNFTDSIKCCNVHLLNFEMHLPFPSIDQVLFLKRKQDL